MIVDALQFLVAFVLVLAPLVFIHELGHFLAAKSFGIAVPVFSLGFGPRIFGFRRGGTDYRISWIPLGGYVRMKGDESDEHRTGAPDEFLSKPKWQRFVVFVAGAAFNIVLAFVAIWVLYAIYGVEEPPQARPTIWRVSAGSGAEAAGVLPGDRLVAIEGREIDPATFMEVYTLEIVLAPDTLRRIEVERDGRRIALELNTGSDPKHGVADPGWSLALDGDQPAELLDVSPGDRAEQAGLRPGDVIVGVDGQEPLTQLDLRLLLSGAAEQEMRFRVRRDGELLDLTVVPREDDQGRGFIGVVFAQPPVPKRQVSLGEAASASLATNLRNSRTLFVFLKRFASGQLSPRTMSGPIGIAQVARRALIAGAEFYLGLLGFFSLQLGILNLLPIPVLDGGHILILGVEGVMRRDLSERLKERVMLAGLLFLLLFMTTVIYFDVIKSI